MGKTAAFLAPSSCPWGGSSPSWASLVSTWSVDVDKGPGNLLEGQGRQREKERAATAGAGQPKGETTEDSEQACMALNKAMYDWQWRGKVEAEGHMRWKSGDMELGWKSWV